MFYLDAGLEENSTKCERLGMSVRIDDLDRKILRELQRDAGQSLDDIAKSVGSSKTPVWNRIRKMRENGPQAGRRYRLYSESAGSKCAGV